MPGWFHLFMSMGFEILASIAMKQADGMTRLWPALASVFTITLSFWFFSLALRSIPLGIAYAVWSGITTACVSLVGVMLFKETMTVVKVISVFLIIAGVVGLNIGGHR